MYLDFKDISKPLVSACNWGVFFNFEYQLRSYYSSSYTYPSYSFYSNGSSTSASLNITSKGVRGVLNDDLRGCIGMTT